MPAEALAIAAMASWAAGTLALRGAVPGGPIWAVVVNVVVEAVLVVALYAALRPEGGGFRPVPALAVLAGLFGVTGSVLFGLSLRGTAKTGVLTAISASYPVLVVIGAGLLFQEPVTWRAALSVALLIVAIWIAW